ncbi:MULTISPECIES: SusD/RagB family nutrient-binding outer membrane lipoprotein [Pedobacter]|uniref:SusD/RagB family nutrient-binding outer membrane lipoprotein n=1 Tax=Pedobacter TaxID=84567 RepID=UPI00210B4056|nr:MULTISPECIES: SusD/RagB family nutrient-binding outer membrane lipoprotein [unclassified Pedobacter]
MKTNILKTTVMMLVAVSMLLSGCDKGFEELNTDPIGTASVEANQLLAPALVSVLHANMVRNRNFNNELMQVTVDISDAEGKVFRYDFRRNWSDYLWNAWYPQATNFKDIYTIASRPGKINESYQGISLITQAWVYSLLTDTYGDVPYSQANEGKNGIVEPAYDRQMEIYLDLFSKLEEANRLLSAGKAIVASGDPVFKGDIGKWRKFGNSLYLRLLLRVSGKSEVSADVIAKIKEMIDTNPGNYPIMQSNDDTAKILWNGTNSSTAVYSSPFMVSVRPVDFRGVAISSFFIDRLRDWADPRMDSDFGKASVPRWGIAQGSEGYSGVPSGFGPGMDYTRKAYFYSDDQNDGYTLQTDPYTGILMNCAEVNFILAEAAVRGWIDGSAADYYNKGMFYSINYWLPTWATGVSDPRFTKYVTDAEIGWDESLPLNATTGSSKLEQIHVQKYYAMFLVDMQQWFEYRRTGHPILPKGAGLANGGVMPARMAYPIISQSANPTSYKNAIAAQGPDEISTQVWWQKP